MLTLTGSLTASYIVAGCGGGSGRTKPGTGGGAAPVGRNVNVSVVPPPAVQPSLLRCSTGWSSVIGLLKPVSIMVMQGNPTLAFVHDSTNGKVVMVGMIDDAAIANTIDYGNVAATLIFLKMGGVQTPVAWRQSLWRLVLADPAAAPLAAVVGSRLTADAYALENKDPQILTALQTAVAALQPATVAALKQLPASKQSKAASQKTKAATRKGIIPFVPLVPAVDLYVEYDSNVDYDRQHTDLHKISQDSIPDFLFYKDTEPTEFAFLIYERARIDATHSTVRDDPPALVSGPSSDLAVTTPLNQATDIRRDMSFVLLRPVFDSPISSSRSEFQPYFETWKTILSPIFQRTSVHIAVLDFMEAIGRGGMLLSNDQILTMVSQLNTLSSDSARAILTAGLGTDLAASVNGILNACLASDALVKQLLHILSASFGVRENDVNEGLLRSTYRLSNWIDVLGSPGSEIENSCTHSILRPNASVSISDYFVLPLRYKVIANPTAYGTTGMPVTLSVDSGLYPPPFYRSYHWKLSGSGNATITDDAGHTGREFDSDKKVIRFVPQTSTTGDQTISVRIDNTEGDTPVFSGNLTLVLPQTHLQLIPDSPLVDSGTTKPFEVQYSDGTKFPAGATFKWTLEGKGSIGGSATVTTTVPTIDYAAPNTPNQDTLTVEVLDSGAHSIGKLSTVISVSIPSRITPHNPQLDANATKVFTVAPLAGAYPAGATFTWTLAGKGSLGGGNPVVTKQPQVTYNAPSTESNDTLEVTVKDAAGKAISRAGTTITIGAFGGLTVSKDSGIVNGIPLVQVNIYFTVKPVASATLYRINLTGLPFPFRDLTRSEYDKGAPPLDLSRTGNQHEQPYKTADPTGDFFYNVGGGVIGYALGQNTGPADQEASIIAELTANMFKTYNPSWTIT